MPVGATYLDIDPIPGRVLIFEQEGIPHTGEEVTKGVKYSVRTDLMYELVPAKKSGGLINALKGLGGHGAKH